MQEVEFLLKLEAESSTPRRGCLRLVVCHVLSHSLLRSHELLFQMVVYFFNKNEWDTFCLPSSPRTGNMGRSYAVSVTLERTRLREGK
jgi:hypothetical protein